MSDTNEIKDGLIQTGNVKCQQCGEIAVPEHTSKEHYCNPEGIVPHVIYGTCTECNHDQSSESF